MKKLPAVAAVLVAACITGCLQGAVRRIEITSRQDLQGGKHFGLAGAYERVIGKIYYGVDPKNPINHKVKDLNKAPVNASGEVEFSADLYVLKPKDMARGNGAVIYGVLNRGRRGLPFNRRSPDPSVDPDVGDGFLMRHGF